MSVRSAQNPAHYGTLSTTRVGLSEFVSSCGLAAHVFQPESADDPRQLLAHCFKLTHDGERLLDLAGRREIFEGRRQVAGRRREGRDETAEFVRGLVQP